MAAPHTRFQDASDGEDHTSALGEDPHTAPEECPQGFALDVLAKRYGLPYEAPVGDAARRVILVMRPTHVTFQ